MKALIQAQVFSRRDIQGVLDSLSGVVRDMTQDAPAGLPIQFYRRGFEAAIKAVSEAIGVPEPN
jgi:hypothetical protein